MKSLEKKQIIILSLIAVMVIGFGLFRFYPLSRRKLALKDTRLSHLNELEKLQSQKLQIPILREKVGKLSSKVQSYDSKIPETRDLAPLWQQIAEVIDMHNLKDQIVQPGSEIRGPQLCSIPISIQCSGSLKQIFDLFDSFDRLERLVTIEQVELKNDPAFRGRVKMNAKANVYYKASESENI